MSFDSTDRFDIGRRVDVSAVKSGVLYNRRNECFLEYHSFIHWKSVDNDDDDPVPPV